MKIRIRKYLIIIGLISGVVFLLPALLLLYICCLFSEALRKRVLYEVLKARVWFESLIDSNIQQLPYALISDKLDELTVHTFIQCAVHAKYELLVMDGKYVEEMVIGAWNQIMLQYSDTVGGDKYKHYLKQRLTMVKSKMRYKWICSICQALKIEYREQYVSELKRYGYNRPYTKETIVQDIEWVLTAEKRVWGIYTRAKADIENDTEKAKKSKPTEQYYYDTLAHIRAFAKYEAPPHELALKWSMATYCHELNRYNTYAKEMKKLQEENLRNRKTRR